MLTPCWCLIDAMLTSCWRHVDVMLTLCGRHDDAFLCQHYVICSRYCTVNSLFCSDFDDNACLYWITPRLDLDNNKHEQAWTQYSSQTRYESQKRLFNASQTIHPFIAIIIISIIDLDQLLEVSLRTCHDLGTRVYVPGSDANTSARYLTKVLSEGDKVQTTFRTFVRFRDQRNVNVLSGPVSNCQRMLVDGATNGANGHVSITFATAPVTSLQNSINATNTRTHKHM